MAQLRIFTDFSKYPKAKSKFIIDHRKTVLLFWSTFFKFISVLPVCLFVFVSDDKIPLKRRIISMLNRMVHSFQRFI